jgi:hypothetical protein
LKKSGAKGSSGTAGTAASKLEAKAGSVRASE